MKRKELEHTALGQPLPRFDMKVKELELALSYVKPFAKPKLELEQYATDSHVATRLLYTAHTVYDDIENKMVLDLGCGCGMLSIAAIMLGARHVVGVELDSDALVQCRANMEFMDIEEGPMDEFVDEGDGRSDGVDLETKIELINTNVLDLEELKLRLAGKTFDTAILNPPFGTKDNAGVDMAFLETALTLASCVYSLHKSSTRDFITKKAKECWQVREVKVLARIKFEIKHQFHFHRKESVMVDVDLIRLAK